MKSRRSKSGNKPALCRLGIPAPTLIRATSLLIIPVLAVFCWQWANSRNISRSDEPSGSAPVFSRAQLGSRSQLSELMRPVANPLFAGSQSRTGSNPFESAAIRAMITAQGNPFLEALASGITEGTLTVRRFEGGLPVFGPPLPRIRASDSEVLKAIQLGVGGSFRDFFANVFRDRSSAADDAEDRPESAEENPFQRALNSLAEQAAEPAAKAPEPAAADDSASKAPAEDPAKAPSPAGAAAVTTVRPLVVLHVGDDGVLQASAASRPREGAIESAKFGVKDFALLPFANPMDFPIALTVADFNGDSLPDVCAHVAWQGQLRFFFGASDGTYNELYRIDVGRGPRSIAAADLDGNGLTDLAVSDVGTGTLTALLAQPGQGYRFRVAWLDVYRDYIAAGRNVAGGDMEIVGVNFANRAEVLWAFRGTEVLAYSRKFEYSPALESQVADARGRSARLNTALFGLSWSINLENQYSQLTNVLNVAAGSKVHVVIGDVNTDGSLIVAIATPR